MERALEHMTHKQLAQYSGIDRFGLWYGYAQYGVGLKDSTINWRQDTRFKPYDKNQALATDSGAFVKDALEALRIYGYDVSAFSGLQGLASLNRMSYENPRFTAAAQDASLLYQFGKYNLRPEVEAGKQPVFTNATVMTGGEVSAVDNQSAHILAETLAPEFRSLFQEKVAALAKELNITLLPSEQRKEGGFVQRFSKSSVPLCDFRAR